VAKEAWEMMHALVLAAALALPCIAVAAETAAVGMITILEGDALIYRGSGRVHAAEGVRLAPGDIVQTAASTFVQIELADQAVAQLGPTTRVMLNVAPARQKSERWLYLMDGWAKLSGVKRDGGGATGIDLRAPLVEIPACAAVVVLQATAGEVDLFVERGESRIGERQASGPAAVMVLRTGDFYRRKAGARGAVNPGSMQAFIDSMPRPFRDSLPLRAERFRDQIVRPNEAPDFQYADVEVWLDAEPAVRRPLVQRWRVKARDAAFRASLVAHLSQHPEWDPVLFPEKYLPKEQRTNGALQNPRGPAAAASSAAR
jgi:hypothetical protein